MEGLLESSNKKASSEYFKRTDVTALEALYDNPPFGFTLDMPLEEMSVASTDSQTVGIKL